MDKSGSYVPLDDIDDNTTLYGTYIKEEIEITSETPLYNEIVLYTRALFVQSEQVKIKNGGRKFSARRLHSI